MDVCAKDFTNKFKGIKAEVLALKQTKKYGLNRTNFDTLFITKSLTSTNVTLKLTLNFDTNSNTEPFVELNFSDFGAVFLGIQSWTWDSTTKSDTIIFKFTNFSQPIAELNLISTKPILSYVCEEI